MKTYPANASVKHGREFLIRTAEQLESKYLYFV